MAIVCLGECIVDFIAEQTDVPLSQNERYRMVAGGAPANVAVGLHYHGVPVRLISRVGDDAPGHFLLNYLNTRGISDKYIQVDPLHRTRIAFVGRRATGERYFEFHNVQSADQFLELSEIPPEAMDNIRIFHFGGVAFLGETTALTTLHLLQHLSPTTIITFDPNVRLSVGGNTETMRMRLLKALEFVHLLKCSREDWEAVFTETEQQHLMADNRKVLVITNGASPTELWISGKQFFIPVKPVTAVDTTGAGDAFMAALLAQLYQGVGNRTLPEVSLEEWETWIGVANTWGARCVQFMGGVTCYGS